MAAPAAKPPAVRPWMNRKLSPSARAELVLRRLTQAEKLQLVTGYFGSPWGKFEPDPKARMGSAGYTPGLERLGLPAQWETDAGLGVATQGMVKDKRERTALPSGLATAATWDPDLAFRGGAMIGDEARRSGFNIMLAGGVDLVREPRNGRNFEYAGEDPLLAGVMDGAEVAGIQSNHIVSTIKHYALNDQETGRFVLDVRIDPAAARQSDLLAFQIALERGRPGSVMCSYNHVNGVYACENDWLLNKVLKGDWGFKGFVMSDWGADHSTVAAAKGGLDQESGVPFDKEIYFGEALGKAVAAGQVPQARLDDMARRVLHALFAQGVIDHPVAIAPIDYAAHAEVTCADAEAGAVLLKNANALLPLSPSVKRIVVIGGHADKGVQAGGGSSLVYPIGGNAAPGLEPTSWPGPRMFYPSSPLAEIQARAPGASVTYADGSDPAAAAKLAASADVVLVFATQWVGEALDAKDLALPDGQDALIAAVAAANPKTVVVLETGGPVKMPWLDQSGAVLEAWYPGTAGGKAIARVLFGEVNPSGRLPVTFPKDESQLPRPKLDGVGLAADQSFPVTYSEGAAVGYKGFDAKGLTPLFPFGYGLSYASFAYSNLAATPAGAGLTVSFTVANTSARKGQDTPQVYVGPKAGGWEAPRRLGGWKKVDLLPGGKTRVTVKVDPRLLATWDEAAPGWRIAPGAYQVWLGASSRDLKASVTVRLAGRVLPVSGKVARAPGKLQGTK